MDDVGGAVAIPLSLTLMMGHRIWLLTASRPVVSVSVETSDLKMCENCLRWSKMARHNFTSTPHLRKYKVRVFISWIHFVFSRWNYFSPIRSKSDLSISKRKSSNVNNSPKIIDLEVESILLMMSHSLSCKSIDAEEELGEDDCSCLRRWAFAHNSCRGDRQMPNLRVALGSVFWTVVLLLIASTSLRPWWVGLGESDRSRGFRSLTSLKYLTRINIYFRQAATRFYLNYPWEILRW